MNTTVGIRSSGSAAGISAEAGWVGVGCGDGDGVVVIFVDVVGWGSGVDAKGGGANDCDDADEEEDCDEEGFGGRGDCSQFISMISSIKNLIEINGKGE